MLTALVLKQPFLLASAIITALVLQIQHMGVIEPLELAVFDNLSRMQADAGADSRLLVVAITESDIQALKRWPVSDQTLSELLIKLQQYKPKIIGLDLYRDIPQPPGNKALLQQLLAPNIITITKLDDVGVGGVPPPPTIPQERVGFNDFVLDPDGIVRRNLIFASTGTQDFYSFALRLSLGYLADQDIKLKITPNFLQIGKTEFVPLEANSGGYETVDAQGYQTLLRYRSAQNVARQVSVTQVLQGQLNPSWVKDKVVLIGTVAPSLKDLFNTPYSAAQQQNLRMPGVIVHAQMVSQILTAVLDHKPLFWFWPQWGEVLWIGCWSLCGGAIVWRLAHPLKIALAWAASLGIMYGISYSIFTLAGWVPLVAPTLALIASGASIVIYKQATLQIANKQLQHLAAIDGLTQVANRRSFDQYLAIEWLRMAREQQPISLIMCDIDYFKSYNDTYGHPAGDSCLQLVAGAISRGLKRPADLATRYGGEEFALILPNTDALGAVQVAEMVHQEIQKLLIPHAASAVSEYITLSLGVASTIPSQGFSIEELIATADAALYEAKKQGRNRFIVKTLSLA